MTVSDRDIVVLEGERRWRVVTTLTTVPPSIRPLALAVVRRRDELLVFEGHDPVRGLTFYRPLGGGIEFGESSEGALRRELREELAVELTGLELAGVLENVFEFRGEPGHEIVFAYSATVADPAFYERPDLGTVLDDGSPVWWLPLADVVTGRATLYPTGLVEVILTAAERARIAAVAAPPAGPNPLTSPTAAPPPGRTPP